MNWNDVDTREKFLMLQEIFGNDQAIAEHYGFDERQKVQYKRQRFGIAAYPFRRPRGPNVEAPVPSGKYVSPRLMFEEEIDKAFKGKSF